MKLFGVKKSDYNLDGIIDLHSHVLPGIDDGSVDLDTSVALVRELVDSGVKEIFATPHYVDETIYVSPSAANLKLLDELRARLADEGVDVKLHLGNEIYITPRIIELLEAGEISALGGDASKYLLVELPMSGEFSGYADIFLKLLRAGYLVVLAHPERYTAFQEDFDLAVELYDMGVLLQSNFGSFAGRYGKDVLKLAEKLAKSKMIWGVGSDIHHVYAESFIPDAIARMRKFYSDDELKKILVENPKKILG